MCRLKFLRIVIRSAGIEQEATAAQPPSFSQRGVESPLSHQLFSPPPCLSLHQRCCPPRQEGLMSHHLRVAGQPAAESSSRQVSGPTPQPQAYPPQHPSLPLCLSSSKILRGHNFDYCFDVSHNMAF